LHAAAAANEFSMNPTYARPLFSSMFNLRMLALALVASLTLALGGGDKAQAQAPDDIWIHILNRHETMSVRYWIDVNGVRQMVELTGTRGDGSGRVDHNRRHYVPRGARIGIQWEDGRGGVRGFTDTRGLGASEQYSFVVGPDGLWELHTP
jgi:hypothetical protein